MSPAGFWSGGSIPSNGPDHLAPCMVEWYMNEKQGSATSACDMMHDIGVGPHVLVWDPPPKERRGGGPPASRISRSGSRRLFLHWQVGPAATCWGRPVSEPSDNGPTITGCNLTKQYLLAADFYVSE